MNDRSIAPILVTGAHRSGTTWVGQVLAADRAVGYIHEPFTLSTRPGVFPYPIPFWYYRVTDPAPAGLIEAYGRLLRYEYAYGAELHAVRSPIDVARMLRDMERFARFRLRKSRPLVKDPLGLFSADWVARTFDASVVVTIRHPLAFVSSLVRLGWRFDFEHLSKQKEVLDFVPGAAADLAAGVTSGRNDPVLEAAYLWKVLNRAIARFRQEHPDWMFVRYEDLARDPVHAFVGIFDRLGLRYDDNVRRRIEYLSGAANPAHRRNDARVTRVASDRHAAESLRRLTPEESSRVKEAVSGVSSLFYADDEW